MSPPENRLAFRLFGLLSGEAVGIPAICVMAVLVLACATLLVFH